MNPTRTIAVADGLVPAIEVCRRLHVNDETLRAICEFSRFMQPEVRPGPGGGKRYFREASIARCFELERPIDQVNSPDRDGELVRRYRMERPGRGQRRSGADEGETGRPPRPRRDGRSGAE